MRHKLERILSQLLPRISCCLDKVKRSMPRMAVKGFNPIASSEFFELCVRTKKTMSKLCSCIHEIKKLYRKTLKIVL